MHTLVVMSHETTFCNLNNKTTTKDVGNPDKTKTDVVDSFLADLKYTKVAAS